MLGLKLKNSKMGPWYITDTANMATYINTQTLGLLFLKVHLHGARQAVRLAPDMLQRDLLRSKSVYMVGSCRVRLLHIIHVSAIFGVGVLQRKLRQLLTTACAVRQL